MVLALASLEWCFVAIVSPALDAKLGCALEKQGRPVMLCMYIGLQLGLLDADRVLLRIYTRCYKEATILTLKNPGDLGFALSNFGLFTTNVSWR